MTIYITVSYRDHRTKPEYAKITASLEQIRQIINLSVDSYNGRCYHDSGKYLKLFMNSDCPEETLNILKSIAKGGDENAEIRDSNVEKL